MATSVRSALPRLAACLAAFLLAAAAALPLAGCRSDEAGGPGGPGTPVDGGATAAPAVAGGPASGTTDRGSRLLDPATPVGGLVVETPPVVWGGP
jgi:hypothetical protein